MEEDPVIKYLRENAINISELQKIYVKIYDQDRENIYDIWYLVNEDIFETESKICQYHCDISNHFPKILFDIMIIPINQLKYITNMRSDFKCIYGE